MSDVLTDKVVLFDGVCNFCDSSVQFIIKHDKSNSLKFASLQTEFGQNLLKQFNHTTALESVVFFENNQIYTKSTADLIKGEKTMQQNKQLDAVKAIQILGDELAYTK